MSDKLERSAMMGGKLVKEAARRGGLGAAIGCAAALAGLSAAAQPYAGIGGTGCDTFLAAGGFRGQAEEAQVLEWVSGFASGINLGRQFSGQAPIDLEPVAGRDWIGAMTDICRDGTSATISGAALIILMPVFKGVAETQQ